MSTEKKNEPFFDEKWAFESLGGMRKPTIWG
jgi:hypothetical protein